MIKRTTSFIEVAYFLSKYGQVEPPMQLHTNSWKTAYHIFYEALNEGRAILVFENSLRNARNGFDNYIHNTQRKGWKDKAGKPNKLKGIGLDVFNNFENLSEHEVWERVSKYANIGLNEFESVYENLLAIEESEKDENILKTEGGEKVYISSKVEREPSLRNDALKIHGYDCAVCGFNFEKQYGDWGKSWAEVHHLVPISESKKEKRHTNPSKDLVVLCANCHRMIHRKKGIALTLLELKGKLKQKRVNS